MGHEAGILYGVGVGPGEPELLTLKAVRIIEECDVIGIPAKEAAACTSYQIALKAVPKMAEKRVLPLPVPMTTDPKKLEESYDKGTEKITELLSKGCKVALLNLGDPAVYGSYLKFHEKVKERGYQAEIVSGVPSFCAAAAALELSLGQEREEIHIFPACYSVDDLEKYAGTKILMKSAGRLNEIKEKLTVLEKEGRMKAYGASNCGMERQAIYRDISELDDEAGYFTTIIIKEKKTD